MEDRDKIDPALALEHALQDMEDKLGDEPPVETEKEPVTQAAEPRTPVLKHRFQGRKVILKDTGTEFVAGEVFRPSWSDLRYVMKRLYDLGLGEELVPGTTIPVLLGSPRSVVNTMVPVVLERAAFRNYGSVAPFMVRSILWVIACYWHMNLGGPRPAIARPTRKVRLDTVVFRCPYCNRKWEPEQRAMPQDHILREFGRWLYQHARDLGHRGVLKSTRHIKDTGDGT